jgi:hypothetical protein
MRVRALDKSCLWKDFAGGEDMPWGKTKAVVILLIVTVTGAVWAQQSAAAPRSPQQSISGEGMSGMQDSHDSMDPQATMQGKDHQQMPPMSSSEMHSGNTSSPLVRAIQDHSTSGTSVEPESTPAPMLMMMKGNWMLMFHGEAFLNAVQQSSPRGSDKVFLTNWFMPMAQHQLGPGTLTLRTMLSFEPATIPGRYYPELFQQGETAFGRPIADGQHPHDFFMELAALYDLNLGANGLLSLYFAPVGDPALGPTAYPHRASASENPIATLGHHLEDSTHISSDVVTAGLTYKFARFEASGFHGREPDENRWNIDSGKIDSWSLRATVNPAPNWSAQYSFGRLASPEALHPDENLDRMTASLMYNRPLAHGNWASTLVWGRNSTSHGLVWNGYLAESTLRFAQQNYLWGRIENVDRTNELLFRNQFEPPDFDESIIGRVQAYTAGYEREFALIPGLSTGIGGQFTVCATPRALSSLYGAHPVGAVVFLRIRAGS